MKLIHSEDAIGIPLCISHPSGSYFGESKQVTEEKASYPNEW